VLSGNTEILAVFVSSNRFAPELISPELDSFGGSTSPVFQWTNHPDAVSYRLQVSKNSGMTDLVIDESNIVQNSFQATDLNIDQVYHWWVIASNINGNTDWSPVWRFSTAEEGTLSVPGLLSPQDNAQNTALSLSFSWDEVFGAEKYQIQLSKVPDFSQELILDSLLTQRAISVSSLEEDTEYFWRVRTNRGEFFSNWSGIRTFKTLALPKIQEGRVGHWKMDEGSGNLLLDSSGNGNDGIIQNTSGITWSEGVVGLSLNLNGFGGRNALVTHTPTLEINNALTISAWVKPNVIGRHTIVSKAAGNGFELWLDANGQIEFRLNRGSNGSSYRMLSNYNYSQDIGKWIHVAATFDGSTQRIYVNGVLDISSSFSPFTIGTNSGDLVIGALGTIQRFNGGMDDLMLYSRALSASEISLLVTGEESVPEVPTLISPTNDFEFSQEFDVELRWASSEFAQGYQVQVSFDSEFIDLVHELDTENELFFRPVDLISETAYYWRVRSYNEIGFSEWSEVFRFSIVENIVQPEVLLGYWKMDEGSGNSMIDHSGNGNNAIIQNTSGVNWSQGMVDLAINLTGQAGRYGIAPHSPSLELQNAVTIATWVKPNVLQRGTILQKESGNGIEFWLDINGQLEFRLNRGNSGSTFRLRSSYNYTQDLGKWVHLAATFDGTTSRIYVNGVENVSANYGPLNIGTTSGNLVIGALGTIQRFNGAMDDLRLYGRALSAGEILNLINLDIPSPETPQLLFPSDGNNSLVATSVEYSWNVSSFAEGYIIQVASDIGFNNLLADNDVANQVNFESTNLLPETTYYWRVRAYNLEDQSPWSEIRSFTTLAEDSGASVLVGHWKMDEGSGNTMVDHSGNGNNAIIQNTTGVNWSEGILNQAINLNGFSGRFGIAPHNSSLEIPSTLTIAGWVKPNVLHKGTILQKENGNGFEFWLDSNGQLEFRLNRGNNGTSFRLRSTYNYGGELGSWIHVAATYDGTTSRIYINGVENISASYGPINIGTTSGNLVIGALGSIQRFNGALDDIRLYGRALSAAEITHLANPSQALRISGASAKISSENTLGSMVEDSKRQREFLEKPSYLYPNPVQDILNLMVYGEKQSSVNIMIFDSKGVLIMEREFETNNGVLTIDVNSMNLKPGIHILLVNKEGNLETLKFIKK
jgi:hypothetical protein